MLQIDLDGSEGLPPVSNTGVEMTEDKEERYSKLVDWLSLTFTTLTLPEVRAILPPLEWQPMERGMMGYRSGVRSGHVTLLYDGGQGMGVHLIISGSGCRELEALGFVSDWRPFMADLLKSGAAVTRFDVAFDDRAELIKMDRVEQSAKQGLVSTHFRKYGVIVAGDLSGTSQAGKTVTFGSRQSESYVRIYDKAAQMQQPGHWVRVEVETKDKTATELVKSFVSSGDEVLVGYLRSILDFKEQGASCERSRWETTYWWEMFLQGVSKVRLHLEKSVRTLEDVKAWIERQVAPLLAVLVAKAGGNYGDILHFVDVGSRRITKRHRALYSLA